MTWHSVRASSINDSWHTVERSANHNTWQTLPEKVLIPGTWEAVIMTPDTTCHQTLYTLSEDKWHGLFILGRFSQVCVCSGGLPVPGQDWGVPHMARDGVHPVTGYAWTGYAAGGTPVAVSRRRTVLFYIFLKHICGPTYFLHGTRHIISFSSERDKPC